MTNERIIQIDSVDAYNKLYGWETLHPLVTVANHANPMASDLNHSRLNYGLYALFLKQGDGCSVGEAELRDNTKKYCQTHV